MIHELKILPVYFNAIIKGDKTFEVRKNDRGFKEGDYVILKEFDSGKYTGRYAKTKITYLLDVSEYCKEGYVIFGIKLLDYEK